MDNCGGSAKNAGQVPRKDSEAKGLARGTQRGSIDVPVRLVSSLPGAGRTAADRKPGRGVTPPGTVAWLWCLAYRTVKMLTFFKLVFSTIFGLLFCKDALRRSSPE